tara:strand:- start:4459 stop:4686 length:228 start_codon:yes stop_codon:yes gene_type:complete
MTTKQRPWTTKELTATLTELVGSHNAVHEEVKLLQNDSNLLKTKVSELEKWLKYSKIAGSCLIVATCALIVAAVL